jgi:hypothetical protein
MISPDEPYEAWKRRRADAAVPDDFADRVLAALGREPAPSPLPWRAARVGIGSLAGAVFLCRVLQVLALFLTGHASF